MNGKRVKALRESFLSEMGYYPTKAKWRQGNLVSTNEFRRYKKNFTSGVTMDVGFTNVIKKEQEYVTSLR